MTAEIPLNKIADSGDIARVILLPASCYAPVITGTKLIIDGDSTKV